MKYWPLLLALLAGCQFDVTINSNTPAESDLAPPGLPAAVSNNAVALVPGSGGAYELVSLAGLVNGKTWRHVSDRVFAWRTGDQRWRELDPVPGGVGRLAATAQTVNGQVYFFGGYTVAEDGTEVSTPDGYQLDPPTGRYQRLPDMPVAVDDTVSAVHLERYIYLVSGWHDKNNVDRVQVFDTQTRSWLQATPFPGAPVFGHAGGISGNTLVICDGVKVQPTAQPGERRSFVPSPACFSGAIDPVDPTRISWRRIPHHPGPALYRSAAAGLAGRVVFLGGTDNPYNYNGVGYDGRPSEPSGAAHAYVPGERRWQTLSIDARPTMDHRGMLVTPRGHWLIVGGMNRRRELLSTTTAIAAGIDP